MPNPPKIGEALIAEIRDRLNHLSAIFPTLSAPAMKRALGELHSLTREVEEVRSTLDVIKDPGAPFDPTDPDTAGRLVALALLAQERVPLGKIAPAYGSGVYAIYYQGQHPFYAAVSSSETPLYVGKADPERADARSPREQGTRLYSRLSDHRRMIITVDAYAFANPGLGIERLPIKDFECRRLVCATNAQLVAERHLIQTFRPVWNSEVRIAYGISKHGDAATTRSNKRSPWDVLHPGRPWALDTKEDQQPKHQIISALSRHFKELPPIQNKVKIIEGLLATFNQKAPITATVVSALNEEPLL